jgi:hypothetical protein
MTQKGVALVRELRVPVHFSINSVQREGRISFRRQDFPTFLQLFSGEEEIVLQDDTGNWRARIRIWEPVGWLGCGFRISEQLN